MTKANRMFIVMKHTRMFAAVFSDPHMLFTDRTEARTYVKEKNAKARKRNARTRYSYSYTLKTVPLNGAPRNK